MGKTDVMSTDELPAMGAPARRALASIGVNRLSDLVGHSRAELTALHGFGPKALAILDDELARHRLPSLR